MKGTRPLSTDEIISVSNQFDGTFEIRNRSLFMLGVSVGGRISELLALRIDDVWQNGAPVSDLLFQKDIVKGKETARMIPVNDDGRKAIRDLIAWHRDQFGDLDPKRAFFMSRQGNALNRSEAHNMFKQAFAKAGLNEKPGKLSTHSMRKTFSQRFYEASHNVEFLRELLGHKTLNGISDYVTIPYNDLREAVKAIELSRR